MNWKSWSWKILLLIIVGGLIFLWLIKAPIMSWYLTNELKVPTSMSSISIWPSQTTIRHFRIINPRGFKTRSAFEADTTQIMYRFKHLRANPSEVDRIEIDGIYMSIECSNPVCSKNNWTAIGGLMAQKEQKAKKRDVIIHKFILSNMTVEVRGLGFNKPPFTKTIDYLEFDEVSSEKGFPTDKLIQAIFQGAGLQDYIQDLLNPQNAIKQLPPGVFRK
jgi:hypothetical protein